MVHNVWLDENIYVYVYIYVITSQIKSRAWPPQKFSLCPLTVNTHPSPQISHYSTLSLDELCLFRNFHFVNLLMLSIISVQFIYVIVGVNSSFFFIAVKHSLYKYTIIYSSILL